MAVLTEADVEQAALEWLAALGWRVSHGPDIGFDTPGAEGEDYGQAVLAWRLRDALADLNPGLPVAALDDDLPHADAAAGRDPRGPQPGVTMDVCQ